MLGAAVALGGHHHRGAALDGAFEQEDVRLLAGLQDAELGVDGGLVGHHPARPGLGTTAERLYVEPGGPALVDAVGFVEGAEVEDERRVEVSTCGQGFP